MTLPACAQLISVCAVMLPVCTRPQYERAAIRACWNAACVHSAPVYRYYGTARVRTARAVVLPVCALCCNAACVGAAPTGACSDAACVRDVPVCACCDAACVHTAPIRTRCDLCVLRCCLPQCMNTVLLLSVCVAILLACARLLLVCEAMPPAYKLLSEHTAPACWCCYIA